MDLKLPATIAGMTAAGLLLASMAQGYERRDDCEDGVDCVCDCLMGPEGSAPAQGFKNGECYYLGIAVNPAVVQCEDGEALPLQGGNATTPPGGVGGSAPGTTPSTDCTGSNRYGCGAPDYGPWYDVTGSPSGQGRGTNQYWRRKYGDAGGGNWKGGTPSSPVWGAPCGTGLNCYLAEWSKTQSEYTNAGIDIMQDGEFDDEHASSPAEPVCPEHMSCQGVFDGKAVVAYRTPRGDNQHDTVDDSTGLQGVMSFGGSVTEWGLTMAMAYPADHDASGVFSSPQKMHEFGDGGSDVDQPYGGNLTSACSSSQWPFCGFRYWTSKANCDTAKAGATFHHGDIVCPSGQSSYNFEPTGYIQSQDWPDGTYGCLQVHMKDMGTDHMEWWIGHNGKKVFHVTDWDSDLADHHDDYTGLLINNYANANQFSTGGTAHTTYRFEDNMVLTAGGPPVSCETIGFTFDIDGDEVHDESDNCLWVDNAGQQDSDTDGYGNLCDADFNDNGVVGSNDVANITSRAGQSATGQEEFDMNSNGTIDSSDVARAASLAGLPPGPSGLACAGTSPCP